MSFLSNLFKKYTGPIRSFKLVYVINNLLNGRKLRHNRELYRAHGLGQSIYAPIGRKDFKETGELPWLDRADALPQLRSHPQFKEFSTPEREQLENFVENGFMVFKGFYSPQEVATLSEEIDRLRREGSADFNYTGRKLMDIHRHSDLIDRAYFKNERLLRLLNFAMGRRVIPFQTISFIEGSEQRAHSDSIHMMTQPEGYLIAAWTALEATSLDNGALFYYPKSHRLPILTTRDYDSGNTRYRLGKQSYRQYEERVQQLIEEQQLERKLFFAEPGDVFVWHANLLHGGSPIGRPGSSRRSMVAHYFCEGVICYHEISQRPALLELD